MFRNVKCKYCVYHDHEKTMSNGDRFCRCTHKNGYAGSLMTDSYRSCDCYDRKYGSVRYVV